MRDDGLRLASALLGFGLTRLRLGLGLAWRGLASAWRGFGLGLASATMWLGGDDDSLMRCHCAEPSRFGVVFPKVVVGRSFSTKVRSVQSRNGLRRFGTERWESYCGN